MKNIHLLILALLGVLIASPAKADRTLTDFLSHAPTVSPTGNEPTGIVSGAVIKQTSPQAIANLYAGNNGFPFGTPIIWIGDSITDDGYIGYGYAARDLAKTGGRYQPPVLGNRGSAGENSSFALHDLPQTLQIINDYLPRKGVVIFQHGTNGDPGGEATTVSNIDTIANAIIATGWTFILHTVPQDSDSSLVTQYAVNRGNGNGFYYVLTNDLVKAAQTVDGTHFNDQGADIVSNYDVAILNMLSANTTQNLYTLEKPSTPDGTFTGSSGTVQSPCTGTMPTGWTIQLYAGDGACTVAQVVENGYNALEITVTPSTTNDRVFISNVFVGAFSAGEIYDAWISFRVVSGLVTEFSIWDPANVGAGGGGTSVQTSVSYTPLTYPAIVKSWIQPFQLSGTNFNIWYFIGAPLGFTTKFRVWAPRTVKLPAQTFKPRLKVDGYSGATPSITGTATVGSTLTAPDTSHWIGIPTTLTPTYQWRRDNPACAPYNCGGTNIAGATGSTYVVQSADSGHVMTLDQTVTNSIGSSTFTTFPTGTVP